MKKTILCLALFGSMAFAGYIGTGGVKDIKDIEYTNKTKWYEITCADGKSHKVGRKDGASYWQHSMGMLPSQFNKLSISEVASKACE